MWPQLTFILFLLLFGTTKCAQISSALFQNYALVGFFPSGSPLSPSRFSYVALLTSSSNDNSNFHITTVFHLDDTIGFGTSVALGAVVAAGGANTTIAAVGAKVDSGEIYIFDMSVGCSPDGCVPWITYVTTSVKGSCSQGSTVVAGTNFVASYCPSNLLRRAEGPPPAFTVCTVNELYSGSCHLLHDLPLGVQVCSGKGGQLFVSAMDARQDLLAVAFCAVCSVESGNTLSIRHSSGYSLFRVSFESVTPIFVSISNRSSSCPSSIAVNSQWVIVGYSDEGGADFYAATTPYDYVLQESINSEYPVGFGAYVDCDEIG